MVRLTRSGREYGGFALQADVDIEPLLQMRSQVDADGGAESENEDDVLPKCRTRKSPKQPSAMSTRAEQERHFRQSLADYDRESGYASVSEVEEGWESESDCDVESEDEGDDFHAYLADPFFYARPSDIALDSPPYPPPPLTIPSRGPCLRVPDLPGNILHPGTNAKQRSKTKTTATLVPPEPYKNAQQKHQAVRNQARNEKRMAEGGSEPVYPECRHLFDFIPAWKHEQIRIPPLKTINRKRIMEAKSIQADIDLGGASFERECVSSSGVKGLRRKGKKSLDHKQALEKRGFQTLSKQEFDGIHPVPVIDSKRRRFMTLAGRPVGADPDKWQALHDEACGALEETAARCSFTEEDRKHRRGSFRTLAHGWTFGGGKLKAGPSINTERNHRALVAFVDNDAIKKICHFQSNVFHMFAPVIWQYYFLTMTALVLSNYGVDFTFTHSVFAALTVNFGPVTACFKHVDDGNLSWGWCAITALGNFDPDYGGHLVIWELKLIIPFPPGSTILLPSALLSHSNIPIRKGEVRYSLTQYSASGLFRWVENGHMSDLVFEQTHTAAEVREWKKERGDRWKKGLGMFSVEPE